MNVWIWGPPLWRLSHSISFLAKKQTAKIVSDFISTFSLVLPCKYCRKSFKHFFDIVNSAYGMSLTEVVNNHQLARWMYDIHELVNRKLERQTFLEQVEKVGDFCPHAQNLRGKRLSYDCLIKRHELHPVTVSPEDIFDILFIFALNYPKNNSQKLKAYGTFLTNLLSIIYTFIENGDKLIPVSKNPFFKFFICMQKLHLQYKIVANEPPFKSKNEMFYYVFELWASFYNITVLKNEKKYIKSLKLRYEVAKAAVCKHGSCK